MEKKREKRQTGTDIDRFMITTSGEMGQKIRKEARRRGLSFSKLIGEIFEEHFNETQQNEEE